MMASVNRESIQLERVDVLKKRGFTRNAASNTAATGRLSKPQFCMTKPHYADFGILDGKRVWAAWFIAMLFCLYQAKEASEG